MDFAFTDEQKALSDVARRMFREHATHEKLRRAEEAHTGHLPELWQALASSELLGLAFKTDVGGAGLGLVELALLLEQVGWTAAQLPVVATLVLAGLPIDEFGTADQRRLLEGVVRGERLLTAALVDGTPLTATPSGGGWRLDGVRESVPAAHLAERVLVPAVTPGGQRAVFLVPLGAPGLGHERQLATTEEPLGRLTFTGVELTAGDVLAGDVARGEEILAWTRARAEAALCAVELGVVGAALQMTAKYSVERHQFERAIGSFQAVAQRVGDAYVDVETIRLTTWHAIWLLSEGRDATRELAVARYWAAEAGHRVVAAAQHVHAGMGFDRDYPLYRQFLLSKHIEFTLGSAPSHLALLGAHLARG